MQSVSSGKRKCEPEKWIACLNNWECIAVYLAAGELQTYIEHTEEKQQQQQQLILICWVHTKHVWTWSRTNKEIQNKFQIPNKPPNVYQMCGIVYISSISFSVLHWRWNKWIKFVFLLATIFRIGCRSLYGHWVWCVR